MKKRIAMILALGLLCSLFAGCKKEEYEITPDEQMTIAVSALARSIKAQKTAAMPVCYTVKSVRRLNGTKTMETTASYDTEKYLTVVETRYFDGETQTGSETTYTFVRSHLGLTEELFEIVSATETTENGVTVKNHRILHTAQTLQQIQSAWAEGGYGADMAYQTYGRMEKLIVSAAMSQGGVEVKLSSSTDFTFSITDAHKTERYTVENNLISQLVWTEWTANGEDENTWNYFWNVTDVTFPDLTDGWALAE